MSDAINAQTPLDERPAVVCLIEERSRFIELPAGRLCRRRSDASRRTVAIFEAPPRWLGR